MGLDIQVHVLDLAGLYVLVLNLALSESGTDAAGPYGRYYLCNAGNMTFKETFNQLAHNLHARSLIRLDKARGVPPEKMPPIQTAGVTSP
jgi:hypothetical protein